MNERLKKEDWTVRPVSPGIARRIIERFHYASGASNTYTYLHGLFKADAFFDEECAGVAWWIPPTKSAALATYPERWQGVLALSRLVIVPGVPSNACSFLISRSRKIIDRKKWPCLVTYADEWQEHTGSIYLADNWTFVGKTKPERGYSINGRMTARKAGPNTRTHTEMLALGALPLGKFAKLKFINVIGEK